MKKKKMIVLLLVFSMIISSSIGTLMASEKNVQAASTYSGKIWKIKQVSLRKSKSKKAKSLRKIKKGTKVTVHYTSGSWRKVTYKGSTGWVLKKYVYISTSAPKLKGSSYSKGTTVATFAKRFVGNSYVWGGTSLNSGADCSGFVKSVYKSFGYNIPRSSSSQRKAGKKVSSKKIQPGDLVCYSGHVAMYIGSGKIVHASSRKTGIKISPNYKYRKVLSIRRIVK
ncbi:MAG: C40 family peptidase [Anaerostipes sp.]|nr:C40 family peptidase [Anaerostipes sp.]MDD3746265.1 C40 family peptidase [Anaerostipes sp.]